jgi:streptogramin lyase
MFHSGPEGIANAMNARTLDALTLGASLLCLSACGGANSTAGMPSPQTALSAGRSLQTLAGAVTYPVGAVNGRPASAFAHGARSAGFMSPAATGKNLLYVSNLGGNAIEIFKQRGGHQSPLGTITSGVSIPGGLTVDRSANLYVANEGADNVSVYPPGATSPSIVYTTDLSIPTDTAVAKDGTVYIANFNGLANGWVSVYPQGNTSNEYRLSDFSGGAPLAVALDAKQNLYVMYDLNNQGSSAVNEYAPGATTGTNLNLQFQFGADVQVDKSGDVLVVQQVEPSEILLFPPGQTGPSQAITLPNSGEPFAIAVSHNGKILFAGDSTNNLAQSLAYPSGTFNYTIAGDFENPAGVAISPDQY